ncbi:hypothetical protein NQ318_020709 [Aromia moschata]|uniref:Uncharacterized protein n=1 Tax=Aromia moschata TaxID=1265417 RepID=A0AAV8YVR9_9CUCU|nr:hypothetical protein NQ318_020709 [Aromia moschata]
MFICTINRLKDPESAKNELLILGMDTCKLCRKHVSLDESKRLGDNYILSSEGGAPVKSSVVFSGSETFWTVLPEVGLNIVLLSFSFSLGLKFKEQEERQ